MKPRTKLEKEVYELSGKLPNLTPTQEAYAKEHCFKHEAAVKSAKNHTYYCLDCGEVFKDESKGRYVTCPHCHHKLLKTGEKKRFWIESSMQMITKIDGYYVYRTFCIIKRTHWKEPAQYCISECIQRFIKPNNPTVVLARSRMGFWHYSTTFNYNSELSIKHDDDMFLLEAFVIYRKYDIMPLLKRNGYIPKLSESFKWPEIIDRLIGNPHWETVVKKGRIDVWEYLTSKELNIFWPQVKMIMRKDYVPKDMAMWRDTLIMAKNCKGDYFSPKVIIPDDLKATHDKFMHIHREIEERKWVKRQLEAQRRYAEKQARREEEEKQYEKKYVSINKPYLGICIVSGDITIRPLQNRAEFEEEGKVMHHCVATYFKREESLILSAKQDGKRIATIELDKKNFSVVQCRAYCNQVPERYDELMNILKQNRQLFTNIKRL